MVSVVYSRTHTVAIELVLVCNLFKGAEYSRIYSKFYKIQKLCVRQAHQLYGKDIGLNQNKFYHICNHICNHHNFVLSFTQGHCTFETVLSHPCVVSKTSGLMYRSPKSFSCDWQESNSEVLISDRCLHPPQTLH